MQIDRVRRGAGLLAVITLAAGGLAAGPPAEAVAPTGADLDAAELVHLPPSEWVEPFPLRPRPGQQIRLVATPATHTVRVGPDGRPQRVRLRSYNGLLVGPTIHFKAGDTLNVRLDNRLERTPDDVCHEHHDPERPFGYNLTNLHTHGLHISPSGISDNVRLCVAPGRSQVYKFDVLPAGLPPGEPPGFHYPGTFWYHAHVHGSTAVQLASGMAGALLLEGDIDQVPEIRAADDRLFVMQQLAFDASGQVKRIEDINCNWQGEGGSSCNAGSEPPGPPKHTTINGRVKPKIKLRPGQVERWRWIDAGIFEMLPVSLEGHKLYQIAVDGITLPMTRVLDEVEMGPGYRTDVMVKAADCPPHQQPCEFKLWKGKSPFSLTGEEGPTLDNAQVLAVVEVSGPPCSSADPCATRLPTRLPAPTRMLPDIPVSELTNSPDNPRPAVFSVAADKPPRERFLINGRVYHHEVHKDFQLVKGDVEEWLLKNPSNGPHPFHIHVNAFQMLDKDGNPDVWRDTIIIPPRGELRMRTRYERFTGTFVLHCHILTHEDLGMMQLVEIRDTRAVTEDPPASESVAGERRHEAHNHQEDSHQEDSQEEDHHE